LAQNESHLLCPAPPHMSAKLYEKKHKMLVNRLQISVTPSLNKYQDIKLIGTKLYQLHLAQQCGEF